MTSEVERLDKQIAEADARRDQLVARRQRARARERERERKRDARRKIIIGGALLARARAGDAAYISIVQELLHGLGERDAKAFEGWELGLPEDPT